MELPTPRDITHESTTSTYDSTQHTHAAVDSDWAGDTNHRKSVTGISLRLCGGTILYKTKFQDCVATSSTEAEFTAACDAGKAILYVRSILDEIDMPQDTATTLYIDNNGALLMGNAQQPTCRTKHMDIKNMALQDWVQKDLILMKRISTTNNYSDALTKPMGRQLHYRHNDYILGKLIPHYAKAMLEAIINSRKVTTDCSSPPFSKLQNDSLCSIEQGGGNIHKGGEQSVVPTIP